MRKTFSLKICRGTRDFLNSYVEKKFIPKDGSLHSNLDEDTFLRDSFSIHGQIFMGIAEMSLIINGKIQNPFLLFKSRKFYLPFSTSMSNLSMIIRDFLS